MIGRLPALTYIYMWCCCAMRSRYRASDCRVPGGDPNYGAFSVTLKHCT